MKKYIAFITAALLFSTLCGCGDSENTSEAKNTDSIYGQISSISGNDVVIQLAEYHENQTQENDENSSAGDQNPQGGRPDGGNFDPENMPEGGEMPDMGDFDPENMPEGFDPENMPQGGEMPDMGDFDFENMPEGFDPENIPQGGGFRGNSGSSNYTLTGEERELRIPVGVTVTTALGVETDFEVLKVGNIIECSVKTDSEGNQAVTAVRIVE